MAIKIIAEIGVNHDGQLDRALSLIGACAEAGADYAKFQAFRTDDVLSADAERAAYQTDRLGEGTQADMVRALELSPNDFRAVVAECKARGITFLATPFDDASLDLIVDDLGSRTVKIGSGDLDNLPLLVRAAAKGVDMIVSTGMATLGEIEIAVGALCHGRALHEAGRSPSLTSFPSREELLGARERLASPPDFLTLLHCTSEYPVKHNTLNMGMIGLLRRAFDVRVGFSDHSTDHVAAVMAVALGSKVLERHITYDRAAKGPDHAASLSPEEFAEMVRQVRAAEVAMGPGRKVMSEGERGVRRVARKRIVARRSIAAGERIGLDAIAFKRAREGMEAGQVFDVLDRPAARDLAPDEALVVSS